MKPVAPAPRGFRFAAIAALVVSLLVGVSASTEAMQIATQLDEMAARAHATGPTIPYVDSAFATEFMLVQVAVLRGMQESRTLLLALLALASGTLFVSAARLLRPRGLPRAQIRKIFVASAIASAVLRTIEGAQTSVLLRRLGEVAAQHLKFADDTPEAAEAMRALQPIFPWLYAGMGGVFTLVVAGIFVAVAGYFGSENTVRYLVLDDERRGSAE